MTTYTATVQPGGGSPWNDPAVWGGVVPNAPDADVVVGPSVWSETDSPGVSIEPGESFAIRSLALVGPAGAGGGDLDVAGTLRVAGAAVLRPGSYLIMDGPLQSNYDTPSTSVASFSAGSLLIDDAFLAGSGTVTAGSAVIEGDGGLSVYGDATFGSLRNAGTIVGRGTSTVTVTGGVGPVASGVLSGGGYDATFGQVRLKGGGVITTDAASIVIGEDYGANVGRCDLSSFDAATGTYRPLESTLTTIAAGGVLTLLSSNYVMLHDLTVAGTLNLVEGASFTAPSLTVSGQGRELGIGSISAAVVNNGVLGVGGSRVSDTAPVGSATASLVVHGAVRGNGTLQVGLGSRNGGGPSAPLTLELDGAVSETVAFQGSVGVLKLDQVVAFSGSIAGFGGQDAVVVANVARAAVTEYSYSGSAAQGVLTVFEGGTAVRLGFSGSFTTASFGLGAGPGGALAVTATGGPGGGTAVTVGGATSYFGAGPVVGFVDGRTGASQGGGLAAVDGGGPGYLQWQFINAGLDDLAVSTQAANVFLHSGAGNDALQVASGTNVLDGGTGSNFLTGGTGTDTFFTDARAPGAVWNTLRNFHAGDAATLWGFTAGVSSYTWDAAVAGAPGSRGRRCGPTSWAGQGGRGRAWTRASRSPG